GLQIECEKVVTSIEVVGIKLDSVLEGVTTFASQDRSLQEYRLLSLSAEGPAPPKKILRSLWLRLNRVFEQITGSVDISPYVANLAEQKVPLHGLVCARHVLQCRFGLCEFAPVQQLSNIIGLLLLRKTDSRVEETQHRHDHHYPQIEACKPSVR